LYHDIALLILDKSFPSYVKYVGPVCVKGDSYDVDEGSCIAVGWGSFSKKASNTQIEFKKEKLHK
jgi:hypothetical protein